MANTAEELSTVSNVSVHLKKKKKKQSFYSLKYGDHKNEGCSLTHPDIKRETKANRRGVRVTRHINQYKCQKIQQVA